MHLIKSGGLQTGVCRMDQGHPGDVLDAFNKSGTLQAGVCRMDQGHPGDVLDAFNKSGTLQAGVCRMDLISQECYRQLSVRCL